MEHQVIVPCPVDDVTQALADPDRLRRCVPGLQTDAEGDGPSEKLRLRVGGTTITYRGTLRVEPGGGGPGSGAVFRVEAEGEEARGDGGATVTLEVVAEAAPDDGGTVLRISGTVEARGRLADVDPKTADTAGRRLLDRFGTELAEEIGAARPAAGGGDGGGGEAAPGDQDSGGAEESGGTAPGGAAPAAEAAAGDSSDSSRPADAADAADAADSQEPLDSPDSPDRPTAGRPPGGLDDDLASGEPVVGNARRTMIGRSTEEVDHAPPRGRYAPVAVPETVRAADTLRWAAPAAAALLASAVVVGRVLRRRR